MNDKKCSSNKDSEIFYWIVSEGAFYAFLYYVQYLLDIGGSLWLSSLILWLLLNFSIVFCPVLNIHCFSKKTKK